MDRPTRAALAAGAGAVAAAGALLAAPERYRALRKLLGLERRTGGATPQATGPVDDVRRSLHDRLVAAGDVVEAPARPSRPAPVDTAPLRNEVDAARARLRARAGVGGRSRPRD
jgi:hypothetical protein